MSLASPTRVGYRAALLSREFRALFIGQTISIGGTSVAAVALTVLVYRRTGSPLLSSLTFALGFLPYLIGGGLLSSLVDRMRPRRLVATCDFTSGLLAAAMAWPALPIPVLLLLLFCLGTLSSVASGARGALVRSTVPDSAYVPARSLLKIAAQSAQIGGNALGGTLLVLLTLSGAILVNAGSFLFSALVVRLVLADHPNTGSATATGLVRDSLAGARVLLARSELRRLLLLGWLAPMFAVAPEALAAPYVSAEHGSPVLVGWWLVALPAGLICGDVAGVRLLSPGRQRALVGPAAAAGFVPYLAFVLHPPLAVAVSLLVCSGACGLYSLGLDGRVRDAVAPELFARTMALNSAGLITLQGVGFALAGAVAEGVGPAAAIALAGGCGLVATTVFMRGERSSRA